MGAPVPPPGPPLGPDIFETPAVVPHGGHTTMSHAKLPPDFTAKPGVHRATTPEMGGPLLVTPAGTTMVATDRLHAHLDQLGSLRAQLEAERRTLIGLEAEAPWAAVPDAPAAARRSVIEVQAAVVAVRSAAALGGRLVAALRSAIADYDAAEQKALRRADRQAAILGAELGPVLRALLPGLMVVGGIAFLGSKMPDPGGARAEAVRKFLLTHPGLITSPRFVEAVRLFASGLDEATSSFLGVPVPVAIALGATGITGVRSSSRGLLTVGPLLGLFRETPVQVERMSTAQITHPPIGAVQRLDRVPEVNQLRIEQYEAPGQPTRYVVYVGPTETFSPKADHEPWDLTSDVGGVGGMDVGAFRASELAMHDAGIRPDDQVQFVGFSEGGLIATMLAGSGEWNAKGLETFGAPAGNIALPDGLSGMAVRNTDDFIPALGGPQLDHHLLQVERRAFAPGTPLPTYHAAPAHQRDAYMASAAAVDAATSNAVREQNAALDAFTADYADQPGSTVTAMTYHAIRVPPDPPAPVDPRVAEVSSSGAR
ncbi:MAG TPA: hypothetical protein VGM70_01580 [Pseudolysinimonas sp.]|jgi:hypothetical protein